MHQVAAPQQNLPYEKKSRFQVVESKQFRQAIASIKEMQFEVVHLLPTTNNRERMSVVRKHVQRILALEGHYCILCIKSEPYHRQDVQTYIHDFTTDLQRVDTEITLHHQNFQFIEFCTGYNAGSSGETREAAKIIFERIMKKCPHHSDFLLRISDDRRESRVTNKHADEETVYAAYRRELFQKTEPVVGGCLPWRATVTRAKVKTPEEQSRREFQCCVQTLFMTPSTFLHIMRDCYDDPRYLSAFCSPLAQDYAFMQCLIRKNIAIEQTSKFKRFTYTKDCPSISRNKDVTYRGYSEEQKAAFDIMMRVFMNITKEPRKDKDVFDMHFDNEHTERIIRKDKDEGWNVHCNVFREWFACTPRLVAPPARPFATTHDISPQSVVDFNNSCSSAMSQPRPTIVGIATNKRKEPSSDTVSAFKSPISCGLTPLVAQAQFFKQPSKKPRTPVVI